MRVADFLCEQHVEFETITHAPAFSSQKRAKYLHVPGRQVAKSVLLAGPTVFVLAVLPATHHVDLATVSMKLGFPCRLANHLELADLFRDCEWGALSPFGTLYGLTTIVDESLDPEADIVFEAHFHAVTITMHYRDFDRLEQPRRFHFASQPLRKSTTSA